MLVYPDCLCYVRRVPNIFGIERPLLLNSLKIYNQAMLLCFVDLEGSVKLLWSPKLCGSLPLGPTHLLCSLMVLSTMIFTANHKLLLHSRKLPASLTKNHALLLLLLPK